MIRHAISYVSKAILVMVVCFSLGLASPAIAATSLGGDRGAAPVLKVVSFVSLSPSGVMGSIFGGLFAGSRPDNLGPVDGKLQPCPSSPNCVCSYTPLTDPQHAIEPLSFTGSDEAAWAALTKIVKGFDNTTVVTEEGDYLYAEFTTSLMGFVDDVEFALNRDEQLIHVRSASRLGQSDLGLNRQRVDSIRAELDRAIAVGDA
ncbi:MAG: DUF1499 domain-containing protein [Cyanobacteria bacterium P01_H01_bin.130]